MECHGDQSKKKKVKYKQANENMVDTDMKMGYKLYQKQLLGLGRNTTM